MKNQDLFLIAGALVAGYYLAPKEIKEKLAGDGGGSVFNFDWPEITMPEAGQNVIERIKEVITLPGQTEIIDRIRDSLTPGDTGGRSIIDQTIDLIEASNRGFQENINTVNLGFQDNMRVLSETGKDIAKTALVTGGTYLGIKTLAPVTPAVSKGLATGVTLLGHQLMLPVTAASPVAVVLGVPAAAAAGWFAGTKFNESRAGQSLLNWSGNLGAKFANTWLGQKIFGYNTMSEYGLGILEGLRAEKDMDKATPSNIERPINPTGQIRVLDGAQTIRNQIEMTGRYTEFE